MAEAPKEHSAAQRAPRPAAVAERAAAATTQSTTPKPILPLPIDSLISPQAQVKPLSPEAQGSVLGQIAAKDSDVLVIGEFHASDATRDLVKHNLADLKQRGFTHLAVEVSPEHQSLLDEFCRELTTSPETAARIKTLAPGSATGGNAFLSLLEAAREQGIKIEAVDRGMLPGTKTQQALSEAGKAQNPFAREIEIGLYSRSGEMGEAIASQHKEGRRRTLFLVGMGHMSMNGNARIALDGLPPFPLSGKGVETTLQAAGLKTSSIVIADAGVYGDRLSPRVIGSTFDAVDAALTRVPESGAQLLYGRRISGDIDAVLVLRSGEQP